MKSHLARYFKQLQTMRDENVSVAKDAQQDSLRRLPWILPTLISLILISLVAAWLSLRWVSTADQRWVSAFGWLDLAMIVWLSLLWLLKHHRLSSRWVTDSGLYSAPVVAASVLIYAGTMTTVEQWGQGTIAIFAMGCVFVGVLFLLRPGHAIAIYLANYAGFHHALSWTQHNPTTLLNNRVQGLFATILGLLLSFLLWRKHVSMILLQRELEGQRLALQRSNEELRSQQRELEMLAHRDALTGLANRREFFRLADMELLRNQRHGGNTSMIMVDVDFFKHINDKYGHPFGDRVLMLLADVLRRGVRDTDSVARIGGEEFAILLPETPLNGAIQIAGKLCDEFRRTQIPTDALQTIEITASFGVAASATSQGISTAKLYAAADQALYSAKALGRNRVEFDQPRSDTPDGDKIEEFQ